MPRKKQSINKDNQLTVRLTESMLDRLDLVAENLELRRSEVIRKAILEFMVRNG